MGMWDVQAWDNDTAADWFGTLMDQTNLRAKWFDTMSAAAAKDELYDFEEARAGLWLFAQLGRVYVWPPENYDEDIALTLNVADKILANLDLQEEVPEFLELVRQDRELVSSRQR